MNKILRIIYMIILFPLVFLFNATVIAFLETSNEIFDEYIRLRDINNDVNVATGEGDGK